ncbi:hypothetical protein BGZ73_000654 [Actinomortierella ambigua]|nr:hypothetical protein BGZ73_000654 [Actinomortierella ambigua]
MVPKPNFTVGQATPEEAQTLFYEWPRALHWNPTYDGSDVKNVFYPLYPDAFRVGRLSVTEEKTPTDNNNSSEESKATSKNVSILLTIRYTDDLGFVALNVVDAAHRGQGLGLFAFKEAMEQFSPGMLVGLDSAVAQVENYKKSGFTHVAWTNVRSAATFDRLLEVLPFKLTLPKLQVIDLSQAPLDELVRLEKQYAGLDRPKFVERWQAFHTDSEDQHRFGVAVVAKNDNGDTTVLGYGAIRPAVTAYRVGPLYAQDDEVAATILKVLSEKVLQASKSRPLDGADERVLRMEIDVPDASKQVTRLLWDVLGFEKVFETVRMWSGPAPPASQVSGLYGVASLEGG